jgi:hypothetical protein
LFTEWRWGGVVYIIERMLPLEFLLSQTFDANVFKANDGVGAGQGEERDDAAAEAVPKAKQGQLDAVQLQKAVTSRFFWGYLRMLWAVHGLIEGLRSWVEGCPCHDCMRGLTTAEARSLTVDRRNLQLSDGHGRLEGCVA